MTTGLRFPFTAPLSRLRERALAARVPVARPSAYAGPRRREVYAEFAGRAGIDATRYGDWEYGGRCTDF